MRDVVDYLRLEVVLVILGPKGDDGLFAEELGLNPLLCPVS